MRFFRLAIEESFSERANERLQDVQSDPSAMQAIDDFENQPPPSPRNNIPFIKGILYTILSFGVSYRMRYC